MKSVGANVRRCSVHWVLIWILFNCLLSWVRFKRDNVNYKVHSDSEMSGTLDRSIGFSVRDLPLSPLRSDLLRCLSLRFNVAPPSVQKSISTGDRRRISDFAKLMMNLTAADTVAVNFHRRAILASFNTASTQILNQCIDDAVKD